MTNKKIISAKSSLVDSKPSVQKPQTMEELLASLSTKKISLSEGQEVEGVLMSKSDNELVLDLGTKSDGVLSTRDFTAVQMDALKVGDKVKAFVAQVESENGQVILSSQRIVKQDKPTRGGNPQRNIQWNKFIQIKNQNSKIIGTITEINKGGLIVEADGLRGFLPGSQINAYKIGAFLKTDADVVGQTVQVNVIEVDQQNNKLIFAQKENPSIETKAKLSKFKIDQKVTGKIVAIFPFGVVLELPEQAYGVVFPADMSWDKLEDMSASYKLGQEVEVAVLGMEAELERVNLSIKAMSKDPFAEIAEKFQTDDVISGVVATVTPTGVSFSLNNGVEGFMPSSKMEAGTTYEVGKKISVLVDSIDSNKRRVNVAPFLTSTKDLIYK